MPARRRRTVAGLALLAPTLAGVAVFFLAPVVGLGWLSTQRWDLLSPPRFAGLDGFAAVLGDPTVARAVLVTLEIGVVALLVELPLGFALGRLMAGAPRVRAALGTALLIPWLAAPIVVGVLARWILAPSDGVLAQFVGHRIDVLADPVLASLAIAATVAWQDTGFAAVVLAGMLATVPAELRAAAAMDGAGRWRTIRFVELPHVTPTLLFLAVAGTVRAAGLYDVVVSLTGGGPAGSTRPVSWLIVSWTWDSGELGPAAALSLLVGVAVLAIVGLLWRSARRSIDAH